MTHSTPIIRCSRCSRRLRNLNKASENGWNAVMDKGIVTAVLCPDCQTPMENAEAVINDATTEILGTRGGRLVGLPKTGGES